MSIWEVVVALMPMMVIAVAGIVLIERLRVKSEGDRYQYVEYRADEELSHDNGMNGSTPAGGSAAIARKPARATATLHVRSEAFCPLRGRAPRIRSD